MIGKSEYNFYKKKGYLVKKNLISYKEINNITKVINQFLEKEKKSKTKIKNLGGTYDNLFVYN